MSLPRSQSLDDWVFALSHVYEKHEPLYTLLSDYWMHATNAAQNVAEEVRRGRPIDLIHSLGSAFAWCCTTAKRTLDILETLAPKGEEIDGKKTYGAWVAHKYPGRCHYCGWPACRCPAQRQVMEERNDEHHPLRQTIVDQYQSLKRERPTPTPAEIAEYQKTFVALDLAHQIEEFDKIYQGANFERTFENICFHYLEEVGEIAREISWLEALQRIRTTEGLTEAYSPVFSAALRDHAHSCVLIHGPRGRSPRPMRA